MSKIGQKSAKKEDISFHTVKVLTLYTQMRHPSGQISCDLAVLSLRYPVSHNAFGSHIFAFLLGEGKREFEAPGGAGGEVGFLIENPRRGGGLPGREGPRGREGVCCELGNFLGGGG